MEECIVLKASAGTGKTYRLSLEYLISLFRGENYKNILVMTFTKKATAEIKERILQFLEKIVNGDGEDILENILKIDSNLEIDRARIKKIYEELSLNRDRLKIYTIDGFINTIFKNVIAPYLNILSYDIIDDTENQEILKKCFEKIVENRKEFELFKEFFEKNTERNIESYLGSIKSLIEDRWKLLVIENSQCSILREQEDEIEEAKDHFEDIIRNLNEIKILKKKESEDIREYFKSFYRKIFEVEDREQFFIENWNEILKDDKCWNGNKTKKSKAVDIDQYLEDMELSFEKIKKSIAIKIYNNQVIEYEKNILSFIKNLYAIYDKIKFSEKRFTHNDISSYTFKYFSDSQLNLIDKNGITDYFFEIFDGKIGTLFIDEFQDTSILQWKILNGIIQKSSRVICVGDEKQSIYGWRGGEKALFENLEQILNATVESLDTSYRSKKSIVDFTNKIFKGISKLYEEENLEKDLKWNFEMVNGKNLESGYIEIIEQSSEEKTALEEMIENIEENFKGNYRDIAIIARANKDLNEIAEMFSEKKIPFVIESNESIIQHRANKDIYKFLKYLVRKDFFSLLEFLRSSIVNIDNITLKKILLKRESIERYLNSEMIETNELDKDEFFPLMERVKKFREISEVSKGNIDELVVKSIKDFGVVDLYSTKSDLKNVYNFIEISKNYGNIYDFIKDMEENGDQGKYRQSSAEEKNAVTLMTIHKSKGLEYETVYFYHKAKSGRGNTGLQFHVKLNKNYNEIEEYIFIDGKYEKIFNYLGEKFEFIKALEDKMGQEEINALYVALTRAKNNLFLVLDKKRDKFLEEVIKNVAIYNSGSFRVEENKEDTTCAVLDIENIELDFERATLNSEKVQENLLKMRELHREFSLDTETKRLVGTAVHYFLENIIYNTPEEREKSRKKTLSKYGSLIGEERICKILDSNQLKEFMERNELLFSKDWDYIYPEYEIYSGTGEEKGLKRIDRIMVKEKTDKEMGKVLIVDYKTGGKNQEQINEYVKLIEEQLTKLGKINDYNIFGEFMEIDLGDKI